MKRAIITTTIYPPVNMFDWAEACRDDDFIVISGDKKTPHDEVMDITNKLHVPAYYIPEHGGYRSGEAVGWNSIQRRNVAVLEAIKRGAEMITTVDTDNFPMTDKYLDDIEKRFAEQPRWAYTSSTGWLNVGQFIKPSVIHRGFPVPHTQDTRGTWRAVPNESPGPLHVGVHASLWLGDPDINALERLLTDPEITNVPNSSFVLAPDTWCPFNSQATTYRRELLPLLNVWPGVGRMDDIWPSYVARYIMDHLGYLVSYGTPNVRQTRHEHDIVTDLENEIIGYRHTGTFLNVLRSINISRTKTALHALDVVFAGLYDSPELKNIIPEITRNFWIAWIADLRDMEK